MKEHRFTEAAPFLRYITQNKERIIGKRIVGYYSDAWFGSMAENPIVFEMEDYCIIVRYYWLSSVTLYIVDTDTFKNDMSLNFLYKDVPGSRNVTEWVYKCDAPFIGKKIVDIQVDRFSEGFEMNPATGELHPDGGDYFSVITVFLDDGSCFHVCAADFIYDGYIETW